MSNIITRRSGRKVSNYFAQLDQNGNVHDSSEPKVKRAKKCTKQASATKRKLKKPKHAKPVSNGHESDEFVPDDDEDDDLDDDYESFQSDDSYEPEIKVPKKDKKAASKKVAPSKKAAASKKAAPKRGTKKSDNSLNGKAKKKVTKTEKPGESSSDDGEDWEEVPPKLDYDSDNYDPTIPETITITSVGPLKTKAQKKEYPPSHWTRVHINKIIKKKQIDMHKAHVLASIAHLRSLNRTLDSDLTKSLVLSILDHQVPEPKQKASDLMQVVNKLLTSHFNVKIKKSNRHFGDLALTIVKCFDKRTVDSELQLILIVASMLRLLGGFVRVCCSIVPIPFQPPIVIEKSTKMEELLPFFEPKEYEPFKPEGDSSFVYWIELYDDEQNKWIADLSNIHERLNVKGKLKKVSYAFAIDNENYMSDITMRYAQDYHDKQIKTRRIEDAWFKQTMQMLGRPENGKYELADLRECDAIMAQVELPKTLKDFKNHPLFVLQKDILKFQAIYPADAPTLGFFRDQPVYARACVHTLKSRETWVKEARTVKPHELAYKIGQTRFPNRRTGEREPLDLFGEWQTKPYEPPVAENGLVPRNPYGNVELFKPCMLPIGCVHLRLPGLARIANKLKIDIAEAVVGFDAHKRSGIHPVMDGFVVCKEFKHILIDAWNEEYHNNRQKQKEKQDKEALENWKRLIKGMFIKKKLQTKYGHG